MSDVLDSNFWSAIVGAVVGGGITIAMQIVQNVSNAKRQQLDDIRSLLAKCMSMQNAFVNLVKNHDQCKSKAPSDFEPWQYMQPIGAIPPQVSLTSSELGTLFELKRELFNEAFNVAEHYAVAIEMHKRYDRNREEFAGTLKVVGAEGPFATYEGDLKAIPWRNHLNRMVLEMHEYNLADARRGAKLINSIVVLMNEKFDAKITWEDASGLHLLEEV